MIGIFDSGSGGLTVLAAIARRLPSTDVTYFGDIAHAPYGSRSREELSRFTIDAMQFLYARGARSIVSACNSVSASLALSLVDTLPFDPGRIIEMVGPTVSVFRGSSARILLVATPATIESGIYENAFRMIGIEITSLGLPDLASAIEFGKSEEEVRAIVAAGLAPVHMQDYDVLILACTHYPLVMSLFTDFVGSKVLVFDPGEAVAERVERRLWPREAGNGELHFCISKDSDVFRDRVAKMFDKEYTIEVV